MQAHSSRPDLKPALSHTQVPPSYAIPQSALPHPQFVHSYLNHICNLPLLILMSKLLLYTCNLLLFILMSNLLCLLILILNLCECKLTLLILSCNLPCHIYNPSLISHIQNLPLFVQMSNLLLLSAWILIHQGFTRLSDNQAIPVHSLRGWKWSYNPQFKGRGSKGDRLVMSNLNGLTKNWLCKLLSSLLITPMKGNPKECGMYWEEWTECPEKGFGK